MPSLFFKADFEVTIKFLDEHNPSQWDNIENEDNVYQTINFAVNDPDDPISPAMIHVGNNQATSGSFICTKISDKTYKFSISGVFKTNVHKDAIRLLNLGIKPTLDGVTRNQDGWSFYDDFQPVISNNNWFFSTNKFK
jgi:hypothetical protein